MQYAFVECVVCTQLFFTQYIDEVDVSSDEHMPIYAQTTYCPVCKKTQIVDVIEEA